MEMAAIGYARS